MAKKIISHILRSLLGLVFIYSAYTKFYPIDNFELFIFGNGISNWDLASTFARFLISIELFIGIMLLINIFTKKILKINLIVLILFSLLLAYFAIFRSDITNCNCFGDHFKFTPFESLIKNLILIGINIYLIKVNTAFNVRFNKLILIIVLVAAFSVPSILSPPDYIYPAKSKIVDKPFKYEYLRKFNNDYTNREVQEGKSIICFYSAYCKFCRLAASKITIIEKNLNKELPVYNIFLGNEEDVELFWKETEAKRYPYQILQPDTFFSLSGPSLPAIYFINNGNIEKKSGFRTLSQDEIAEFFE